MSFSACDSRWNGHPSLTQSRTGSGQRAPTTENLFCYFLAEEAPHTAGFVLNGLFGDGGGRWEWQKTMEEKVKPIINPNPNSTALPLRLPSLHLHGELSSSQFPSQANNIYPMKP